MVFTQSKKLLTKLLPLSAALMLSACASTGSSSTAAANNDPLGGTFLQIAPPGVTMTAEQEAKRLPLKIVAITDEQNRIQKIGEETIDASVKQWSLQDHNGVEQVKLLEVPEQGYVQLFGPEHDPAIVCGGSPKFIFCSAPAGTSLNEKVKLQTGYFGMVVNKGMIEFAKQ